MDLGKFGKLKGDKHPRDLRKLDAVPARPTPKAKPRRKPDKPYGFKYEMLWPSVESGRAVWRWKMYWRWYATERQRDQALRAWNYHRTMPKSFRNPTPVEKGAVNG